MEKSFDTQINFLRSFHKRFSLDLVFQLCLIKYVLGKYDINVRCADSDCVNTFYSDSDSEFELKILCSCLCLCVLAVERFLSQRPQY